MTPTYGTCDVCGRMGTLEVWTADSDGTLWGLCPDCVAREDRRMAQALAAMLAVDLTSGTLA